jgi:hypothetical protein
MIAVEKTGLLIVGTYVGYCLGEWLRTGCNDFVFESSLFICFSLLLLAGPYKLYLTCLVLAGLVYFLTGVQKKCFIIVTAYFLAVPFLASTSMCTGGEHWRYALAEQIQWAGCVLLCLFLVRLFPLPCSLSPVPCKTRSNRGQAGPVLSNT